MNGFAKFIILASVLILILFCVVTEGRQRDMVDKVKDLTIKMAEQDWQVEINRTMLQRVDEMLWPQKNIMGVDID